MVSLAAACGSGPGPAQRPPSGVPRPDHVVVVVMENQGPRQVVGNSDAPYLAHLARAGALLTRAAGVTHPSQPNYLALLSGDTHGVADDNCPYTIDAPNLAGQLLAAHLGFTGYAEDLPQVGYTGCDSGEYARRHNPWVDFGNLPAGVNRPFSEFGPDYAALPTVSFVVPNLCNDMHDCGVGAGDSWLEDRFGDYLHWAYTHNSLLVVTWDEAEDDAPDNRIPLYLVGPMVRAGRYDDPVDHYRMLRTLEEMYGLPPLGHAADAQPLTTVWQPIRSGR